MKNNNITILAILLSLTFISCNNKWVKYTVKAGNHSSDVISQPLVNTDEIEFYFKTNGTWFYIQPSSPGWNKIRGFSHGHHQNNSSARLGFQCLNDTLLVVGAYCYVDGVSPQENPSYKGIIDTIQAGQKYHCRILHQSGKYKFYFEDKSWECPAGTQMNWGFMLNPHIGGSYTLDHDWEVEIKDVK